MNITYSWFRNPSDKTPHDEVLYMGPPGDGIPLTLEQIAALIGVGNEIQKQLGLFYDAILTVYEDGDIDVQASSHNTKVFYVTIRPSAKDSGR